MKKGGRGEREREEKERETREDKETGWQLSRAPKNVKSFQEELLSYPSILSPNGAEQESARRRAGMGDVFLEEQREEKDDEAATGCRIGEQERKGR